MKKINQFIYILVALLLSFFTCEIHVNATEEIVLEELGYQYSIDKTIFRFYSSSAVEVKVLIDELGEDGEIALQRKNESSNIWIGIVVGDLTGKHYSYYVKLASGEEYNNVIDPYGLFINNENTRNIVYNPNVLETDSESSIIGTENSKLVYNDIDSILYGINVKNFTNHESWNGTSKNRGKLLGLIEEGTQYGNVSTGYDYISNLGITHLEISSISNEILPFAIDQNLVSGEYQYSGNIEMKEVSNKYYSKGIGIILTFDYKKLNGVFSQNVYKIDRNDFLDENLEVDLSKSMMQKYILDLLKYYAQQYRISGLMIENMADYSIDFANKISEELLKINENMYIYGNGSYSVENNDTAGENSLNKLNNINMLNGSLSYSLFGNLFNNSDEGLLDGNYDENILETLKFTFLSSVNNGEIDYSKVLGVSYKNYWNNSKSFQLVNYLGNKNGLSIYDKMFIKNFTSDAIIQQKIILAFGVLMMSGGTPYIYGGEEFLSSYISTNGESICNSNSSFCFNVKEKNKIIDWSYAKKNENMIDSFKSFVNFRKSDGTIIQTKANIIQNNVKIYSDDNKKGVIGYTRSYPGAYTKRIQEVFVVYNFSNNDFDIEKSNEKGIKGLYNYNQSKREGDIIHLNSNSFYTEKKIKQPKISGWLALLIVVAMIGSIYAFNITMNRILVEKRGYDIEKIKKKYRPFIRKDKIENNNTEQNDSNEESNKKE